MLLITNNKKFFEIQEYLESNNIELLYDDIDYIGILEKCRNLIHQGYEMLTHPLYGSVKPNETIYRSIVLSKGKSLDYISLGLIEEAIETAKKFNKNKNTPLWIDSVKEDFRVIDFDLISKTINRIIN